MAPPSRPKGHEKYTSKYFPPDKFDYSVRTHDNHEIISGLVTIAEREVNARIREGVLLVRMWCDAYDTLVAEQDVVYRQYLILVRRVLGQKIRLQLDPEVDYKGLSAPDIIGPVPSNIIPNAYEDERVSEHASEHAPELVSARASTQVPKDVTSIPATTKPDAVALSSAVAPKKNQPKEPIQTEPKPKEVLDFEGFCKKYGIRVGSGGGAHGPPGHI
ncbi:hypothetical protein F5Y02DRAFT_422458 [Annulohypoxylon stygium]|nr:hypothetical protein F5Y02DRAFT_422458 [Annulohypoxylon stygium]